MSGDPPPTDNPIFPPGELITRHFPDSPFHDPPLKVASMGKSEAERADELKGRASKLLIELCVLMDEGMRDGLAIRWANIAMNAWGRHEVVDLHVQKRF